jgi:hypothetical protein
MTTFDFTERIALFFTRFLEINKEDYIKKVKNLLDKTPEELGEIVNKEDDEVYVDQQFFKGFRIKVKIEFDRQECSGEDCEYDEGEHPLEPKSANLYCRMFHGSDVYLGRCDINLTTVEKDWFYGLVKEYTLCSCEHEFTHKDGWCKKCFPYVCEQEEECCVCKENEGVWVELKCKHIIHKVCWEKTVGLNCPLCRHTHSHKYQVDRI